MKAKSVSDVLHPLTELLADSTDESLSSMLSQGPLTTETLEQLGKIPADERVFLVAHEMVRPTPPHRHDYWEICYVLRGRVINRAEGHEAYLIRDTACIMNETALHELGVVDTHAIVCNVCLRNDLFSDGLLQRFVEEDNPVSRFLRGKEPRPCLVVTDTENSRIKTAMANIIRCYARHGYHDSCELEAWVLLLLCALAEAQSYTYAGMDLRTVQMLEYIEAHPDTVTVRGLAHEFGFTENYLSQYFKKRTGKNASQFIIDAKLTRALDLLRNSEKPVEQVAREVGYTSYSQFHHMFVRRFG